MFVHLSLLLCSVLVFSSVYGSTQEVKAFPSPTSASNEPEVLEVCVSTGLNDELIPDLVHIEELYKKTHQTTHS